MIKQTPTALTIAGSDSGGGAGIQADLKAFSANGVFGTSVVTAVTAQNTQSVNAVHAIPIDAVSAQIDAVLSDINVHAIKIGMLFSSELVLAVANALKHFNGKVVLDPVMIAKSGDKLLQDEAIEALKSELIPYVDLLTPNLPEAEVLLGLTENTLVNSSEAFAAYTQALIELGAQAVLLKGGHGSQSNCTDLLISREHSPKRFTAPRIATTNTHGTGCTYSATIAAGLAKGLTMPEAVDQAHDYLHKAICHADSLNIGKGHGPVHHFHQYWHIDD